MDALKAEGYTFAPFDKVDAPKANVAAAEQDYPQGYAFNAGAPKANGYFSQGYLNTVDGQRYTNTTPTRSTSPGKFQTPSMSLPSLSPGNFLGSENYIYQNDLFASITPRTPRRMQPELSPRLDSRTIELPRVATSWVPSYACPQIQLVPTFVRPVERIVYKDRPVEKIVEKIVYQDREVEKIVESQVAVEKLVYVDKPHIVEKIVHVEVDKFVEKIVHVEVDKIVEKFVEVPVEKLVTVFKDVEVERPVAKYPDECKKCNCFVDMEGKCPLCPLKQRLNQPQAPVISSLEAKFDGDKYNWVGKDERATVQIVHSLKDGWQKDCPVTLYATSDGSEPSNTNFAFSGPPPLEFFLANSASVKAVASNDLVGLSTVVQRQFVKYNPAGVGMLLEKMNGYKGIYVQKVVEGGAVWKHGVIQAGDEIKMIDNTNIEAMELNEVTQRILGQAGSQIRLKVLREDRDADGNLVDEIGAQFWVSIERGFKDENWNPAMRKPAAPIDTLEGFERVDLSIGDENRAVFNKNGLNRNSNSSNKSRPGSLDANNM